MLVFPNCKLNLGLYITGKRADGYHELETCFLPVPGCGDALEAIPSPDTQTRLFLSGIELPGNPEQNLVMKAYRLLNARYPLPPLHIYLHKAVPAGSGVGAGSADAAFALKLFAQMGRELHGYRMPVIELKELEELALQLGSDCPVFIKNKPVLAKGRGEIFSPIELNLTGYSLKILFPAVPISTKEAFVGIMPRPAPYPLADTLALPPEQWQGRLHNDFEPTVFARYPALAAIKAALLAQGAVYAAMSGSGSAVYGLFAPGLEASGWQGSEWTGAP